MCYFYLDRTVIHTFLYFSTDDKHFQQVLIIADCVGQHTIGLIMISIGPIYIYLDSKLERFVTIKWKK